MTTRIDLNCDMGEGYGAWDMGDDAGVMAKISSANIACGFHAGDPLRMRRTVALAKAHGVAVGAHVSLPDLQGFGRREFRVSPNELHALVLYQIGALAAIAQAEGVPLSHVKPHGALYNMAARERAIATVIADAVRTADRTLILYGLARSESVVAAREAGLAVAEEAFADRAYESDGRLTPRGQPGAVLDSATAAAERLTRWLASGEMPTRDGDFLTLRADTICLHGDREDAAAFATTLRKALEGAGIRIAAPGALPGESR